MPSLVQDCQHDMSQVVRLARERWLGLVVVTACTVALGLYVTSPATTAAPMPTATTSYWQVACDALWHAWQAVCCLWQLACAGVRAFCGLGTWAYVLFIVVATWTLCAVMDVLRGD